MAMREERPETLRTWYEPTSPADSASSHELRERWTQDPTLSASIREALQTSRALPENTPTVALRIESKEVSFLDLRGYAFQGLNLGKVDLSYACLDFSDLRECAFEETSLQFSTLRYSLLDRTRWHAVQASPISLRGARLRHAQVSQCFLQHSDFHSADLTASTFIRSILTGGDLRETLLTETILDHVDLRGASFSDTHETRRWYASQTQDGNHAPNWIGSNSTARSSSDDAVVMLIEDFFPTRELLAKQLKNRGYRVEVSISSEAINNIGTVKPDLVLLDLNIPGIDALEVVRRLRRHVNTSALPVVLISRRSDRNLRQQAFDAGATEYFTTPLQGRDWLTRIGELLANQRRQTTR